MEGTYKNNWWDCDKDDMEFWPLLTGCCRIQIIAE